MSDDKLEHLIRYSLDEAADSQRSPVDLHARSVASGRKVQRRRMAALATVVVACLVGGGAAAALRPSTSVDAGDASSPVQDLVSRVERVHEVVPTTGYWFVKTEDDLHICGGALMASYWRAPNGSVRVNGSETAYTEAPGQDSYDVPAWAQLVALPTDPTALRARLQVLSGQPASAGPDLNLFQWIGDVLADSPASPAVRARLIQVLADDPAVQVIGYVTDPLGRPALELDWKGLPTKTGAGVPVLRLMLDPATGRTLAYRMTVAGADAGGVTVFAAGAVANDHASVTTAGSAVPLGKTALALSPVTADGRSQVDVIKGCQAP